MSWLWGWVDWEDFLEEVGLQRGLQGHFGGGAMGAKTQRLESPVVFRCRADHLGEERPGGEGGSLGASWARAESSLWTAGECCGFRVSLSGSKKGRFPQSSFVGRGTWDPHQVAVGCRFASLASASRAAAQASLVSI